MRAIIDGICRGDGKIYAKLTLSDCPNPSNIELSSFLEDGNPIPADFSVIDSSLEKGMLSKTLVVTLPLFTSGSVTLVFSHDDDESHFIRLSIPMVKAKWDSRFSYRFRKYLCEQIRDFDNNSAYERINFKFIDSIRDGNSNIVRFNIWMPDRPETDVVFKYYDEASRMFDAQTTLLDDEKHHSSLSEELKIHEMTFSASIPTSISSFCLSAIDNKNHDLFGFYTLEQHAFDLLKTNGDSMLCNAQVDSSYESWFLARKANPRELKKQRDIVFPIHPTFSIIVPLYNTPLDVFSSMIDSVTSQSYVNWELVLVNSTPENNELNALIQRRQATDSRIIVITLERNLGITENTNQGMIAASGDFVCFLDHDDCLEPDALFEYCKAVNDNPESDLLYCDEDKIHEDESHSDPFFKPDLNIDLLRSNNYICHFLCVRKAVLDTIPLATSEYDGAQDHNLILRVVEKARTVTHIPRILYHWRITDNSTASSADTKPYANQAGIRAVQEHLDRLNIPAKVALSRRPFTYDVEYLLADEPLVSIIIPNKDNAKMLEACIQSIIDKSTYSNFEIVIIENNSIEQETFECYKRLQERAECLRIAYWKHEFNFSKLINFGAEESKGQYLLLLNNDVELITPNWIERMVGLCAREEVGAVGVRLLYRDNTIQHEGVLLERPGGVAVHPYAHIPKKNPGYFAFGDVTRDYSAVTAACMMTKRSDFEEVGGFTEELSVAFNDVDYCLKLRDQDLLVVYTPEVELFHYESTSRGKESTVEKQIRFFRETSYMHYRWARYYIEGDPQLSPNLIAAYMKLNHNA